jgi:hypothetical protein
MQICSGIVRGQVCSKRGCANQCHGGLWTALLPTGSDRAILPGRVLCGRDLYPCTLLPPDLCAGMSLGSDLCPRILYGPDVSVVLYGPDSCRGIFLHHLCRGILPNVGLGILYGLNGHDLCD